MEYLDISDLTLKQIKEIQNIAKLNTKKESCYPIGKNVVIRSITTIYTGVLSDVTATDLILTNCAWIPETDRYTDFVSKGLVKEFEPFPDELPVFINRGALLDICELKTSLPKLQK